MMEIGLIDAEEVMMIIEHKHVESPREDTAVSCC